MNFIRVGLEQVDDQAGLDQGDNQPPHLDKGDLDLGLDQLATLQANMLGLEQAVQLVYTQTQLAGMKQLQQLQQLNNS